MAGVELFFNLLTRNALVIYKGVAHILDGPYSSREEAELAAADLIARVEGYGAIGHDELPASSAYSR
jgi:hypothetical protein